MRLAASSNERLYPVLQALLAALLFGASAPLAKLLLGEIEPVSLAALLYLGSGLSLLLIKSLRRSGRQSVEAEAPVTRADLSWLAGAVFAGGVAAPIVLMFSLRNTPAATASLLLNFEGVATTVIAALVFKEAIGRRAGWAILCTTAASVLLSLNLSGDWGLSIGALGILAACVLWGIDNNFTRNISAKDPLTIVTIKGLGAGSFSLILALILRSPLPAFEVALRAMILGSLSYGLSVVLFVRAMRRLGAARTSALFSAAPLAGVILSLLLFRELPNVWFVVALPLMLAGTLLVLNEQHGHRHVHANVAHEHRHQHADEHHAHEISGDAAYEQDHSHEHEHPQIEHEHGHLPDTHHRHTHGNSDTD